MNIGDKVNRIEDRDVVEAEVMELSEVGDIARLSYKEGGEGWWPVECIELING